MNNTFIIISFGSNIYDWIIYISNYIIFYTMEFKIRRQFFQILLLRKKRFIDSQEIVTIHKNTTAITINNCRVTVIKGIVK